jgi:predicted MFS family arabinose efflux permease
MIVYIPQRYQTVSGMRPLAAGIRLLPYSLGAAVGSVLASVASSKKRVAVSHILFVGATLQVVGLTLLSTLASSSEIPNRILAFECLAGVGMGINFGVIVFATPFVVDSRDLGEPFPCAFKTYY